MKLKAAIKYQYSTTSKSLLIYYLIFYCVVISLTVLSFLSGSVELNISGVELSSCIALFVMGLNSFKTDFRMLLQNGRSRKTLFLSIVINLFIFSAITAVVDSINSFILSRIGSYESMYRQLSSIFGPVNNELNFFLLENIFYFTLHILVVMVGLFITVLYYKMNKTLKLIVSIGTPCFFLFILPLIDEVITKGKIFNSIGKFFIHLASSTNGSLIMIYATILTLIFGFISFLLIRKAVAKEA